MNKKNVLIFPAGWENSLEVYDALRYNVNVEVYGASGKADCAEYIYDSGHYIEGDFYINNPDFVDKFNAVLEQYAIDVVIPTHDDVCLFLAKHKDELHAKVLTADARTAEVCRHKRMTYQLFSDMDFCPKIYWKQSDIGASDYPLFLKPDAQAGARGTSLIEKQEFINDEMFSEDYVLCENLPGEELTVDCFTNRKGELVFAGARSRDRVVYGMSYRSTTIPLSEEIRNIAEVLNERLSFLGCWYFQVKQSEDGTYKLLEVACRVSGGMTLYRHMGVNFHMMGIFELFDIDTSYVLLDTHLQFERRFLTKYHFDIEYNTVYIDFDDTIIVEDKVCDVVIRFIYQCINNSKRIILLTRHDGDINEIFIKHRLNGNMFDDIIHMTFDDEKFDYIRDYGAIFIDNSFAERKKVSERFHIPVFDVDMVDMLLE